MSNINEHWCESCKMVHGCHCRFYQCWVCRRSDCPVLHPARCPESENNRRIAEAKERAKKK